MTETLILFVVVCGPALAGALIGRILMGSWRKGVVWVLGIAVPVILFVGIVTFAVLKGEDLENTLEVLALFPHYWMTFFLFVVWLVPDMRTGTLEKHFELRAICLWSFPSLGGSGLR